MIAELTKEEREAIMGRLMERIYQENRESLELLSPAQVAGLLDISPKTLAEIKGLPRITIVPNKIIRYRLADVKAWLESNRA